MLLFVPIEGIDVIPILYPIRSTVCILVVSVIPSYSPVNTVKYVGNIFVYVNIFGEFEVTGIDALVNLLTNGLLSKPLNNSVYNIAAI